MKSFIFTSPPSAIDLSRIRREAEGWVAVVRWRNALEEVVGVIMPTEGGERVAEGTELAARMWRVTIDPLMGAVIDVREDGVPVYGIIRHGNVVIMEGGIHAGAEQVARWIVGYLRSHAAPQRTTVRVEAYGPDDKEDAMSDDHAIVKAEPTAPAQPAPMALLERAMSAGADPRILERLLDLQERWERNEARRAYVRDMAAVRAELDPVVGTDATNPHLRVRYATLAALLRAVTPVLSRHGFSIDFHLRQDKRDVTVTCRVTHRLGHAEEVTLTAPWEPRKGLTAAMSIAATITTLRRVTLMAALGLATADEPEEETQRDPDAIDPAATQRAIRGLAKLGIDVQAAEEHVGRQVAEWTLGDIDRLREWATAKKEEE